MQTAALRRWMWLASLTLLLSGCSTVTDWFSGDDEEEEGSLLSGERISVLAADESLKPSASLAETKFMLPAPVAPDVWPQSGGIASHYFPNITATVAETRDQATAGDGESWPGALMAAPVVGTNAVFAMDGMAVVSAHKRGAPSDVFWTSNALEMEEPGFGGGLATQGEVVFAVSPEGRAVALDVSSGKTLWKRELRSPVRAAPRLFEDMLLVPTVDSQLFALNLINGTIRWQHRGLNEAASMLGSSVPAAAGPLIIVAYNSGELYALSRRNGEPLWNESLLMPVRTRASDSFTGISGAPVITGRQVFSVSTNGLLAALDLRTGLRIWEQRLPTSQTPWVTEDFLFVLGSDHRLVALSAKNGLIKWITPLTPLDEQEEDDEEDGRAALHGPYLINGQLLVISPEGEAILVDPETGKIIDRRDFMEGVSTSPAFADGGLYVLTRDATLAFVK
jgi:outer membrane protein assembly factor BamB